jgi:hypothetical protein
MLTDGPLASVALTELVLRRSSDPENFQVPYYGQTGSNPLAW